MLHARSDYQRRIQDADNIIPANEPVMLFRAQDKYAASVLRYYAALVEEARGDPQVIERTRAHAKLMDSWPVKKSPDVPK